jgi:hypothetical protein
MALGKYVYLFFMTFTLGYAAQKTEISVVDHDRDYYPVICVPYDDARFRASEPFAPDVSRHAAFYAFRVCFPLNCP